MPSGRPAARGKHGIREHVLAGKLTASGACGAGRLHILIIRVPRFIGGNHIKKQSQFLEIRSIIFYINNKIRLSSKDTATAFFAKLCYNWKQSFRRRPPPIRRQADRAGCADGLPGRRARPMRAFADWQTGFWRRVQNWQIFPPCHSGSACRAKSFCRPMPLPLADAAGTICASMCSLANWPPAPCGELPGSAVLAIGYRVQAGTACARMCSLAN